MTMVIIGRRAGVNGGGTMHGRPFLHGHPQLGNGEGFTGLFLPEGGWESEGAEELAVDEGDLFFGAGDAVKGP